MATILLFLRYDVREWLVTCLLRPLSYVCFPIRLWIEIRALLEEFFNWRAYNGLKMMFFAGLAQLFFLALFGLMVWLKQATLLQALTGLTGVSLFVIVLFWTGWQDLRQALDWERRARARLGR